MRDARESANLVAMNSPIGQKTYNFFANNLYTAIPREDNVDLLPLARKFNTATSYIWSVGLSDWGWFDQKGKMWENDMDTGKHEAFYPFKMRF